MLWGCEFKVWGGSQLGRIGEFQASQDIQEESRGPIKDSDIFCEDESRAVPIHHIASSSNLAIWSNHKNARHLFLQPLGPWQIVVCVVIVPKPNKEHCNLTCFKTKSGAYFLVVIIENCTAEHMVIIYSLLQCGTRSPKPCSPP